MIKRPEVVRPFIFFDFLSAGLEYQKVYWALFPDDKNMFGSRKDKTAYLMSGI